MASSHKSSEDLSPFSSAGSHKSSEGLFPFLEGCLLLCKGLIVAEDSHHVIVVNVALVLLLVSVCRDAARDKVANRKATHAVLSPCECICQCATASSYRVTLDPEGVQLGKATTAAAAAIFVATTAEKSRCRPLS